MISVPGQYDCGILSVEGPDSQHMIFWNLGTLTFLTLKTGLQDCLDS